MPGRADVDPSEGPEQYLGYLVQEARIRNGWSQEELAAKLFVSRTRVSKIETGTEPPNRDLARRTETTLGLGPVVEPLAKMIQEKVVRDYAEAAIRRQAGAQNIHQFHTMIPGLLQTRAYARAVMRAADPSIGEEIEGYLDLRMERQEVLRDAFAPWYVAVIDEGAVRRAVGTQAEAVDQLEHLLDVSELPNVRVQVLPFAAPTQPGSLMLMTMPNGDRCAYNEGIATGLFTEEPNEVARFQRVYDHLHGEALSPRASLDLIREAIQRTEVSK
nr:helix-turn-helix transcriptional regulator [Streptomyces boncukensis]